MNIINFKNSTEFSNYIKENKPKDIWLDNFSKDVPYISWKLYNGMMSGTYNRQTLLSADVNDLQWVFEKGMYIKECKTHYEENVLVKSVFKNTSLYENWTPVSRFLACGLMGVDIKFILKLKNL